MIGTCSYKYSLYAYDKPQLVGMLSQLRGKQVTSRDTPQETKDRGLQCEWYGEEHVGSMHCRCLRVMHINLCKLGKLGRVTR